MVLGNHGRSVTSWLFTPLARTLNKWNVSPNLITVVGALATSAVALVLLPRGHLIAGPLVVTVLAFADSIDGIMARGGGKQSLFGAFLDSTMDRVTDAAVFCGLGWYFFRLADPALQGLGLGLGVGAALAGMLVSYARARAESVGVEAKMGIAERTDRLIFAGVATLAVGFGAPDMVLVVALAILVVANLITVFQRGHAVYKSAGVGQNR